MVAHNTFYMIHDTKTLQTVKKIKYYPFCKTETGFTLIELLVAMAVFSLIVVSIAGIFVSILNAQRKAIALQVTQEASRFLLESMAKEIRMSVLNSYGSNYVDITNPDGDRFTYVFSGGQLYRQGQLISPDSIEIVSGGFNVIQQAQPIATKVTIVMTVRGKNTSLAQQTALNLQATVSARGQ